MNKTKVISIIYPLTIKLSNLSIQQQLQQFLLTQLTNLNRLGFPDFFPLKEAISLFRLPKIDFITYRCAIAFQLTRNSSVSPLILGEAIFQALEQQSTNTDEDLYLNFTLKLLDSGWLDFTLSDRSLILWLSQWYNYSWPNQNFPLISGNSDNLLPIEYTYSRCCALLRLGEQEGLINLKKPQFKPYIFSLSSSHCLPWFNLELDEIERSLISQIITTVDRLVNESNVNEIKLGIILSDYFLIFERYCRIFGELSRNNPQLSQARLGLVAITQYLLQGLWLSKIAQPPRNQM